MRAEAVHSQRRRRTYEAAAVSLLFAASPSLWKSCNDIFFLLIVALRTKQKGRRALARVHTAA